MRLLTTTTIALAALLVAGSASAAPSKESGPKSQPSEPGGASPGAEGITNESSDRLSADTGASITDHKSWEVGAVWEMHRTIREEDLEGNAENELFNYYSAYFRYDFTKYDRATVRTGLYQRFLADPGESGVRMDDTAVAYTRLVPLPAKTDLRIGLSVYFPTSYASQLQSLRFAPRLSIAGEKRFGRYVSADVRLIGDYYNMAYSTGQNLHAGGDQTANGANPNEEFRLAGLVEAEVAMPFLEDLSIGVSGFVGYIWLYQVGYPPPGSAYQGAETDMQYPNRQPVEQEYGGEVFVRYNLPRLAGIKSDISLALADGDPSLGYSSLLHDGVQHTYAEFRQFAEVYGVLSARF
jgi:hypothetical protein